MKALMTFAALLFLSQGAFAEEISAMPEASSPSPAASVPSVLQEAPPKAPYDKMTLKDGQRAEGKFKGYDAYFLSFVEKNGTVIQVPWIEVASLDPAVDSGDNAIMKQYLKADPTEVTSFIAPKSPDLALQQALWPGFVIHGAAYHYAGDDGMYYSLLSLEAFGVGAAIFGAALVGDTADSPGDQQISGGLMIAGGALFVGSWFVDIIGAGSAVRDFNDSHKLSLSLAPSANGSMLSARMEF